MRSNLKTKKPFQILMSVMVLGGLLLMPQATMAVLWVNGDSMLATCHRGPTEPSPITNTCGSLSIAASSSTAGEIIHNTNTFNAGFTLNLSGNNNTTWTGWDGQSDPIINAGGTQRCIDIDGSPANQVNNVTIENFTCHSAGTDGIRIRNSNGATVQDCIIYENGRNGIFSTVSINASFSGSCVDHVYQRNYIYSNDNSGIKIEGQSTGAGRPVDYNCGQLD